MFASHSSYENPLLYCSYEQKEVGFRGSTAWGQCRVQGNIPFLKETQAGSEERKKVENTWKREITVSVRFLGIKLHIVSGKNYPLKHEGHFIAKWKKKQSVIIDTVWLSYFWWKIEGIPSWWLLFSYSRRRQASLCRLVQIKTNHLNFWRPEKIWSCCCE